MRLSLLILVIPFLMAGSKADIITMLKATAKREGIHAKHLVGVCGAETRWDPKETGDPNERIRSHGLCQIQTRTARWMGYKGHVIGLYNAKINARYSAKYLRWCFDRLGDWNLAYACYNRGYRWVAMNFERAYYLDYVKQVKKCYKRKTCRRN